MDSQNCGSTRNKEITYRPKWEETATRAPLSKRYLMVGTEALIRVSSVIFLPSKGTLRSQRMRTCRERKQRVHSHYHERKEGSQSFHRTSIQLTLDALLHTHLTCSGHHEM
jgi:hypothetical protein